MSYQLKNLQNSELQQQLKEFLDAITKISGSNLKSVILYGGVAKSDYTTGKSNVNLLFIFDKMDLDTLDSICVHFQKAMGDFRMSPFILTSAEVQPSSDVFAVKLFDIQQHHQLLYGEDLLSGLKFDPQHLRFISEMELRNQLSRMKIFYIGHFNLYDQLLQRVQKGFTTLLINANTLLYLKSGKYAATRDEILARLVELPGADRTALEELTAIKNQTAPLSPETIRHAYDQLMLQYKALIKRYKQF